MKKVSLFVCLVAGGLSWWASAAPNVKALYPIFEAQAAEAAAADDISMYATRTIGECQDKFDPSLGRTIDVRAEAAKNMRLCLEAAQSIGSTKMIDGTKSLLVSQSFKVEIEQAKTGEKERISEVDFMGLTWGLGFGYSFGTGGDRIDKASIVNGIVRAESTQKDQPRAIFEFHKYFWCNKGRTIGNRGCGPFVGVAATQDKVLSGVAMGVMYGMKVNASDPDGFSIGVGAILDDDIKDLGNGFKNGEAPPAGETAVRFQSKARWSGIVFVTRTF